MSEAPYNPLAKPNLGRSIADALLGGAVLPLDRTGHLVGAGVYAIYYHGSFAPYAPIRGTETPIYVGKAIPKGARKGGLQFDAGKGTALRDRLRQHATSIKEATNLDSDDFGYRSLVVDDIWIPLGENVLIERFKPIWNMIIDGFGNKDPGQRRATQYKSSWDLVHPGRRFAEKLAVGPVTLDMIIARLDAYFAGRFVPEAPVEKDED